MVGIHDGIGELPREFGLLRFQCRDALRQGFEFLLFLVGEARLLRLPQGRHPGGRDRSRHSALVLAAAPGQPVGIAAREFQKAALARENDGLRDHVVQEGTVVRNQDHRAAIILQELFQQFQGIDV